MKAWLHARSTANAAIEVYHRWPAPQKGAEVAVGAAHGLFTVACPLDADGPLRFERRIAGGQIGWAFSVRGLPALGRLFVDGGFVAEEYVVRDPVAVYDSMREAANRLCAVYAERTGEGGPGDPGVLAVREIWA